ncbi:hypothetical protein LZ30DRAFT_118674 [Colletotrichum cereale]|nr:hypothetical protein LZ30DRAFT_118674 [Colletotrichum cereale]
MKGALLVVCLFRFRGPVLDALPMLSALRHTGSRDGRLTHAHLLLGTNLESSARSNAWNRLDVCSGLCLGLRSEPHTPPPLPPPTRHLDMDDFCPLCRGFHHRRRGCLLCSSPTTCSESSSSSVPTSSQATFLYL